MAFTDDEQQSIGLGAALGAAIGLFTGARWFIPPTQALIGGALLGGTAGFATRQAMDRREAKQLPTAGEGDLLAQQRREFESLYGVSLAGLDPTMSDYQGLLDAPWSPALARHHDYVDWIAAQLYAGRTVPDLGPGVQFEREHSGRLDTPPPGWWARLAETPENRQAQQDEALALCVKEKMLAARASGRSVMGAGDTDLERANASCAHDFIQQAIMSGMQ